MSRHHICGKCGTAGCDGECVTQQNSGFRLTSGPVTPMQALKAADEVERIVGEIANGQRKPGKMPMGPLAHLVQFVRDTVPEIGWENYPMTTFGCHHAKDKRCNLCRALNKDYDDRHTKS